MRKCMGYYVRKGMAVATAATVLATSVPMGNLVVRAEVQEDAILDEDEGYQEDEDEDENDSENEDQGNRGSKARQSANGNAGVNTPSDAVSQATSSNAGVAVTNRMGARAGQKCGENAYWSFDETTGTLTISGTGKMKDYEYSGAAPWNEKKGDIKEVVIEDGITRIGDEAFGSCGSLTKITMGKDVEKIGRQAFDGCKKLSELILGEGVKEIEYGAFKDCKKLKTVKLNGQLTAIGESAFRGCEALEYIAWNNALENIGKSAFAECNSLSGIQFGTGLKTLGEAAFERCKKLKTVRFGDGVETIGKGAFAYCEKLGDVRFGTGLKMLEDFAFSMCDLSVVTLESPVERVGGYAFAGNQHLNKVTIKADSVPTIGDNAFVEAEFVRNNTRGIVVPSGKFGEYSYVWSAYRDWIQEGKFGKCGDKVNWEYHELLGILAISGKGKMSSLESASAYPWHEYRDQIKWVVIEEGVTSVGKYAFTGCNELGLIQLGKSLEIIEEQAFSRSGMVRVVTIPDKVTEIGKEAFARCYHLETITLGDGVKTIGEEAFYMCGELNSVTFGKNLEVIGNSAFYACPNLKCVELKDQVKTIGNYAFSGCNELSSVTLGTGVEQIGDGAFGFCIKLKTVTLGSALKSIGREAFGYCGDLTTVTILAMEVPQGGLDMFVNTKLSEDGIYVPYNSLSEYQERWEAYREYVRGISAGTYGEQVAWAYDATTKTLTISGAGAMDDHSSHTGIAPWAKIPFQTLVIEDGVTKVGNRVFERCDHLETVILGDGVKTIGEEAFYMCGQLNHITLGTALEQIGDSAFEECIGLEHIQLQNQVKSIGNYAFSGCRGLFSVTIGNEVRSIGANAFSGCNNLYLVNMGEHIPTIGTNVFDRTCFVANRKKGIVVPNEYVEECKKAWSEWARYITEKDPVEEDEEIRVRVDGEKVVYVPSNLPSYVEIGSWMQTADGNWTFTSFGKVSNLNSASHGGAGSSGSGGGAGAGGLAKGWVAAYNPYAGGGSDSYDWFYFDTNGVMVTGWFTDTDGSIYYLNPKSDGRRGAMLVGWQWIDRNGDGVKEQYYFNELSGGTRGKLMQ